MSARPPRAARSRPPGPRRLVVVSPSGANGGAETMLLRTVLAAAAQGWQVQCLAPAGPLAAELRRADVPVQTVPALVLPPGPRALATAVLMFSILRVALAVRSMSRHADVVLANGVLALPAIMLAPRGAARVWWAHDVVVRADRMRLARWCSRRLDFIVGVSASVLSPLSRLRAPMAVVRNGVDLPALGASPTERAPYVIGCSAALTAWKGQDVLLEAVARLPRTDVVVELLGAAPPKDAPYEARLRDLAAREDLRGRVHLLGHVADPLAIMRHWHVGVSASVDPEASGLGVLEGMSLGVPQVVTAHGGPPEVLADAGLVVTPADPDAMAEALERLLSDRELRGRCAQAGPRIVGEQLHRPAQERALLDLLGQAVPRRRR